MVDVVKKFNRNLTKINNTKSKYGTHLTISFQSRTTITSVEKLLNPYQKKISKNVFVYFKKITKGGRH